MDNVAAPSWRALPPPALAGALGVPVPDAAAGAAGAAHLEPKAAQGAGGRQ